MGDFPAPARSAGSQALINEPGEHWDLKAVALLFAKQRHPLGLISVNLIRTWTPLKIGRYTDPPR